MKNHAVILVFILLGTSCSFTSCTPGGKGSDRDFIASPQDLNRSGCIIGVPLGTVAMSVTEKMFPKSKILYYRSLAEGYTAVQHKKIDAFIFDRHNMEYAVKVNKDLVLLPEDIAEEHISVALPLHHRDLLREVDQYIEQYRADGTYQEMYDRWFSAEPPPMPDIPDPKSPTRKLKVGTEGLNEPMNYFGKNGELTGFDLEFTRRLALFLNAELEVVSMSFDGLIPSIESGKLDLLIANVNKSEERAERMLFSSDYVDSAVCVMIHKDRQQPKTEKIASPQDLNNKKYTIAGETGTLSLREAQVKLPRAKFKEFSFPIDLYLALESKKVDAVVYDRPPLDYAATRRSSLVVLQENIGTSRIAAAAPFRNRELVQRINEFIKTYRTDGTYDDMYQRWVLTKNPKMPSLPEPGNPTQTLVIGTDCQNEPMGFMAEGSELAGFDIEFIKRLAIFLNAKIEIRLLEYNALFMAAASGKIDLAVAALDATPERSESMLFTDDYIDNPISLMVRKEDHATTDIGINDFSDLYQKRIGVMSGSTYDEQARKHFSNSTLVYINSINDMVLALETKKIDAFVMDEPQFPVLSKEVPNLKRLSQNLDSYDYALLFPKTKRELRDAISEQILAMKNDGTLKNLNEKWFSVDGAEAQMTSPEGEFPKGMLRFATISEFPPMAFLRNGQLVGYDIECVQLAAARAGYRAQPVPMDWNAYLEAIFSGKVDFGVACTAITEERKQKVLFSEPNYHGAVIVVVRDEKANLVEDASPTEHWFARSCQGFADSFERTFLRESRWKLILEGLKTTVIITVFSAFWGTILAFGVCALRRAKSLGLRILGKLFIALMQGMPILVVLMILYYVVFARVSIDAVLVAVIGFSLNFAVYVGEMMRTALDAIPKGQYEAAAALGLKRSTAFRKIIFPQMLRRILPVYRGEFISMLKMTSIVGYIAIQDLTKMSDIIRSRTYEAFFPLIATAVIYFVIAHLLASGLSYLEFRLNPKNRRAKIAIMNNKGVPR